jgi:uncharacterized membrane protein
MKKGSRGVLLVVSMLFVFIAINFFFFVDSRESTENEENGDRSSYHSTPYGTLAYYTLLEQNGVAVSRLEKPYTTLKTAAEPGTLFVIAPPVKYNPSQEEFEGLNKWVESGGLLIIIDREISLKIGDDLDVETSHADISSYVKPLQPTKYTRGVRRLSVSRFASHLKVESRSATLQIGDNQGTIVADAKAGRGRIVLITDPFIVANNGIGEEDNLALALNILEDRPPGGVAFDEYHHGYGVQGLIGSGGLLGYFKGTPVLWMIVQAGLITLLFVYTRGRRFARPLPLGRERRTTNLEFVSSMATITRLARATGLAMESIYSEFRRSLCRYSNLPPSVETSKLADAVSRRGKVDGPALSSLLAQCEGIAHGDQVTDAKMLDLVTRIRDVESELRL